MRAPWLLTEVEQAVRGHQFMLIWWLRCLLT